jgi:hypothetical protein
MRKLALLVLIVITLALILTACGTQKAPAASAVEGYLNALIGKDATKVSNLSCKAWQDQASLELDSFQAVTAKLKDLKCTAGDTDGAFTLVSCLGKIVATYNGENQEIDLSGRVYQVALEGGEWRVCGYK